jgi:hypothetical protein
MSQSHDLRGDAGGDGLIIGVVVFLCTKCILLEWRGGGIAIVARGWCGRVYATLEGLLDHGTKCQPSLSLGKETIPISEGAQVEACCQEEADRVVDELAVPVPIATKKWDFDAILDLPEEYFRGISSRVAAAEDPIALFDNGRGRVAIQLGQLIKDDQRGHPGVPSLDGQVI